MDPRFRRSREALRTTIYELASAQSITEISVAELCRAAGVTRDTFYRHATSPMNLLSDLLREDIESITGEFQLHNPDAKPNRGFAVSERALLGHVAAHAAVYRAAMQPHLIAPLRDNLDNTIRAVLIEHLTRYPSVRPAGVAADDEQATRLLASYASSGTVGAIEAWLLNGDLDIERGVQLILAASPEFWFLPTL
ncbi:MAG: hypothetical protein JWQ43_2140 [Glaciihabitans sp.]|nr:hypothetical protein [Glaciihabitans sp.]